MLWGLLLTNPIAYTRSSDFAISIPANQGMYILFQGDKCFSLSILDGLVQDFEYRLPYGF